ncbi:MAG: divalent-cation tolerance protein CutA [Candidatus Bathyarchaeia archaeon]
MSYVTIVMTTANREEAVKIVNHLLQERLIACANIVGPVSSLFWWKEKIEAAEEFLVFMKSGEGLFEKLSERVKALHSYKVPEVLALPIVKGLPAYLEWLGSSLKPVKDRG